MTTITAAKIAADIVTVTVTVDGRTVTGTVMPGQRADAPSIDGWMSASLVALCDDVSYADDYGMPMVDVIAAEAAAA